MQKITHETVRNPAMLEKLLIAIVDELALVRTLANELKTDMSEHTHGGVTADGGDTAAGATISAAAISAQVEKSK